MDSFGAALQQRLGYRFRDDALLRLALTHRSHGQPNNERLEFLGDAVLDCVVSMMVYDRFRDVDEGGLSRLRANLVRQQSLVGLAQRLELAEGLRLGEGERRSGGPQRPSILADSLEAVLGAVLLDGGFEAARAVVHALYEPLLARADAAALDKDAKTRLQERLQAEHLPLPVYTVRAVQGAAHDQCFEVDCTVAALGLVLQGRGASRRAAEQQAAQRAFDAIAGQP